MPCMVAKEDLTETERTMMETHYKSFHNEQKKKDRKRSAWYRLIFPNDADYTVAYNPRAYFHNSDNYDVKNGFYSTYTNDFLDHYQKQ